MSETTVHTSLVTDNAMHALSELNSAINRIHQSNEQKLETIKSLHSMNESLSGERDLLSEEISILQQDIEILSKGFQVASKYSVKELDRKIGMDKPPSKYTQDKNGNIEIIKER